MSPFEARYRRLLACYPRDHRARHEEEMIGVLLAGARPGQTRPRPAEAADLVGGALRVHGRRAFGPVSAPAWRDGLVLAVALWPFLMLASVLATEVVLAAESLHTRGVAAVLQRPTWIPFVPETVVVAALPMLAVLFARRWIAVLGAVAFAFYLYRAGHPYLLDLEAMMRPNPGPVLLAELSAVVIAFIPTAHRAISLISRRAFLLWGPLALIGLIAGKALVRWLNVMVHHDVVFWKPVPWLVVVALAAGYACRSVAGRRAALLLFLPAAALGGLPTALAQLGCAALAFAAAAACGPRRASAS
ncbi:hypothetical protein GCM10022419_061790 [Nonomuraea rosea]|uniref:Uncharacterized protein n=1 Tax=Nonomuraea rosea TaxID=638574 RepID=A0ABP6XTR9_9ACTN